MFKIAYANKDKIQNSITQGVIPSESLIVTNNDNKEAELSYYDENGNLKSIVKKTAFASKNEALLWIAKYDYSGVNISIFDAATSDWNSYIVGGDGSLNKIAKADEIADELPTASAEVSGIMKLYNTKGNNVDGAISQFTFTQEINKKIEMGVDEEKETVIFGYDLENRV